MAMAMAILGAGIVAADDSYGVFTTPARSGQSASYADNAVYEIGTTLQLKWNTDMSIYQLNMWQQWLNESVALPTDVTILQKAESAVEPRGMAWDVQLYNLDLSLSNVFFFGITAQGSLASGFTSHYFNLTHDAVVGSATASTAISSTPTSMGASTSGPLEDGNDNAGLKLGLGVGLGVGLPLVAICAFAAGFVFFRRKHNGNHDNNNTDSNSNHHNYNHDSNDGGSAYKPSAQRHHGMRPGSIGPTTGMQSAYAPSESQFTTAHAPTLMSASPYDQEVFPYNRPYTPDMGPQQLDGTPKQPQPQHYFAAAPQPPLNEPSELPGDDLVYLKGSPYQRYI